MRSSGIHHDDVIKWKHFPRYRPFVRGIHRSPVNSPHKGQWRGALMFSLIGARINGWVNKWRGWWFETPSSPSWRHCNDTGAMSQEIFKINILVMRLKITNLRWKSRLPGTNELSSEITCVTTHLASVWCTLVKRLLVCGRRYYCNKRNYCVISTMRQMVHKPQANVETHN